MHLSNIAAAIYFVLLAIGQSSIIFVSTETTSTFQTTESIGQWATATPLKSVDSSLENDVVTDDVAKESLYPVIGNNGSSQETTLQSTVYDTTNLETGSGGYESETISDVHEQMEEESLIITTDSGATLEKHSRTIEPSEDPTSTTETNILVTSTTNIDELHVSQTQSSEGFTLDSIEDNVISDTKDNSSRTHSKSVSQSQTETPTDEYPTTTIEQNSQTVQVTTSEEQSTMSDEDHLPTTVDVSVESLLTTTEEPQTTEETSVPVSSTEDVTAISELASVSETIARQTTTNRDRSLQLEDDDQLTTQFSDLESSTHDTDISEDKVETQYLNTTPETDSLATSATSEPTQVESASTLTTAQMSQSASVTVATQQQTSDSASALVTTGQTSHPESVSVMTEHTANSLSVDVITVQTSQSPIAPAVTTEQSTQSAGVSVTTESTSHSSSSDVTTEQASHSITVAETKDTTADTVPLSTELVTDVRTSTVEWQTSKPLATTTVSLISDTTADRTTTTTSSSTNRSEITVTPMTTEVVEVVSDYTLNTNATADEKTTVETNRMNCTSSEVSPTTTTTSGENSELPIMKNVKSYDNLSEPEFFNSVTVIFRKPEFGTKDSMYFNQDVFKKVVVCLLNVYEAVGWSNDVNVTSCNFKDDSSNIEDFSPMKPNDLVIVYPSPKDNEDEEIVSFFVKNSTANGQIVSRNRTLAAIGENQHLLSEQMDMEVVDVYGRIPVALLITPEEKAFHVRHSMLLIILLAVVSSCILAIMTALVCMKCKTQRGRWAREVHDKTQLQGEANKKPDVGDHLNSDEDIRKDETIRAFKNGNGYYGTENGSGSTVINITDNHDAWVVPFNQLTTDEKAVPETLDTKL